MDRKKPSSRNSFSSNHERGRDAILKAAWRLLAEPDVHSGGRERLTLVGKVSSTQCGPSEARKSCDIEKLHLMWSLGVSAGAERFAPMPKNPRHFRNRASLSEIGAAAGRGYGSPPAWRSGCRGRAGGVVGGEHQPPDGAAQALPIGRVGQRHAGKAADAGS
jgi:hypothetical protein